MKAVVSQTWLIAADRAAEYAALTRALDPWLEAQPGFIGRTLILGQDDPTHIVHVRLFEEIEDYLALLHEPEYQEYIEALVELVEPANYPTGAVGREFGDVLHHVTVEPPPGSATEA